MLEKQTALAALPSDTQLPWLQTMFSLHWEVYKILHPILHFGYTIKSTQNIVCGVRKHTFMLLLN